MVMLRSGIVSIALGSLACLLTACASTGPGGKLGSDNSPESDLTRAEPVAFLNRVTWGADAWSVQQVMKLNAQRFLDQQLHPAAKGSLPPTIQAQIDAMTINLRPLDQLVFDFEQRRKAADAIAGDDDKKIAQQAYQRDLTRLANEAATRSLLLALYSPNQLQEQMTWFWVNHFSIFQYKSNLRAMAGDFEERAIRPRALGRFRDLLIATVRHPAMLRYLDNEQNAVGRINENYARELMELHTLGVNGGYTQRDVEELARILTRLGLNLTDKSPNVRKDLASQYVREGLFEFNPNRHDYGDKEFLGQPVKGRGLDEVDEVIYRLCRQPATARFLSHKLAVYFVADDPPPALVERMANAFLHSDGDIAVTLHALFESREFQESLGTKFKDPVHYVVSAIRLAYTDKPILNAAPMLNWLNRMGEPLYGRQTPDGYPMTAAAWTGSGQMTTRFEIAKAIGGGTAGLFKTDGPDSVEQPAFPQLANRLYYQSIDPTLAASTRKALSEANSPQEWNMFLLASPEFMHR